MKVEVDSLNKSGKGWKIRIKTILTDEEFSHIKIDDLQDIEDFQVEITAPVIYFNTFLSIAEPWEDEPLEELIKAVKLEVKHRLNVFLKMNVTD